MSTIDDLAGEVGELLRRLVDLHLAPERQAPALRIAARLMESSLTTSPTAQTAESLSHAMLFRLVRDSRHEESSQLAELTAGLRFERGLKTDAVWPILYVLNDLRESGNWISNVKNPRQRVRNMQQEPHPNNQFSSLSPLATEDAGQPAETFEIYNGQARNPSHSISPGHSFSTGLEPRKLKEVVSIETEDADDDDDDDDDFFLLGRESRLSPPSGRNLSKESSSKSDPEPAKESLSVPTPLQNVSLEKQLVRELLLVIQGENGTLLTFHNEHDTEEAVKINMPSGTSLTIAMRDIVLYTAEIGFLFRIIRRRVEGEEEERSGLVAQNMCSAVVREMDSYFRSLVTLRSMEKYTDDEEDSSTLTLRRIYVWSEAEKPRLRWLARLCEETRQLSGSQILRHLRERRGSYLPPGIHDMVSRVLASTAAPINRMLQRWLSEGVLSDPHGEFFIMEDPKVAAVTRAPAYSTTRLIEEVGLSGGLAGGPNSASTASHRIWWGLYKLRIEQIPGALDHETAEKALKAGKSIAFLRRCCSDSGWVDNDHAPLISSLSASGKKLFEADPRFEGEPVRAVIEASKNSASKRLKSLFFNKFDLSHHFGAIKNYLLLSQGDFSQALMDGLASILDGGADILRNNLTGIVDAALQGCSSFNEDTDQDILERLDVEIAQHGTESNIGWDVFSLTYRVEDAPLNTVFSEKVMDAYLLIFRLLWRLKRMDHLMSLGYMNLCAFDDRMRKERGRWDISLWQEIRTVARKAQYLRMKMTHLVQNMQHYCTVEVLEGSWTVLERKMNEAEDLDEMIYAHSVYLTRIKDRTLLSARSQYVSSELGAVLNVVPCFDELQREMCKWSYIGDVVDEDMVASMKDQIEDVEIRFNESFDRFLAALRKHSRIVDTCLFLLFRLDFNGHYSRRMGITRAASSPEGTEEKSERSDVGISVS